MKSFKYLILFLATLQSCDPYSHGYICNETNEDVALTMTFEYDSSKNFTKESYIENLPEQFDSNLKLIEFDTVELIGKYRIERGKCALVGHGMSNYPHFLFSKFKIETSKDTMSYDRRDKFIKRDDGVKVGFGGNYDFIIK